MTRLVRRYEVITTLAVIGALAILAWFLRAIGLRNINVEFEGHSPLWRLKKSFRKDEEPPKQLNK